MAFTHLFLKKRSLIKYSLCIIKQKSPLQLQTLYYVPFFIKYLPRFPVHGVSLTIGELHKSLQGDLLSSLPKNMSSQFDDYLQHQHEISRPSPHGLLSFDSTQKTLVNLYLTTSSAISRPFTNPCWPSHLTVCSTNSWTGSFSVRVETGG
jgi:hypothetical protein